MNQVSVIENMKRLGFSEYEVKAYISLLEKYPLNGYGLSKVSGIPRSRIYEILNNLEEKQVVFKQQDEESTIYYPLEPRLLVEKIKKELKAILYEVETYTTNRYDAKNENHRMVTIKGYEEIMNFMHLLIGQAQSRIALSIWEAEMDLLKEPLMQASSKGIIIRGIYFGDTPPVEHLVKHRRLNRYLAEKRERYISLIIDGEQVISGVISRGDNSRVTWIKDPGFVEMSEDYISHDVMINAYSQSISGETKAEFEAFSDEARRNYFDYSDAFFKTWET